MAVPRAVASALIRADTADLLIAASPDITVVHMVMPAAITADLLITVSPAITIVHTVMLVAITTDPLITASRAITAIRTVRRVTAPPAAITMDLTGAAATMAEGTTLAAGRNIVPACTKDRRRCLMVR